MYPASLGDMNTFDDIKWPNAEALHSAWRARCASGVSFHNCYVGFGGIWMVKLFLGGQQRLIASSKHGVSAARFADMALLHFHPYRKRRIRPLIDSDLNFNLAQAERDTLEVPEAKRMLVDYERALIARNLIPAIPRTPDGEPPMRDDVLRSNFGLQHQKLGNLLSNFTSRFGSAPEAKLHIDMMQSTLDQLRKQIRSLDFFFLAPEQSTPNTPNTNVTTTQTTN